MGAVTVAVVSCVYGKYGKFVDRWREAIGALTRKPDEVIIATESGMGHCLWKHPQPFYLEQAILRVTADWFWIVDIDDLALPDGLDGIDDLQADVWQLGYRRADGHIHLPPRLTPVEYLALDGNPYAAGSAIRTEKFWEADGFPDIAFQDWGLWRRLAWADARVEPSGRVHYVYNQHPESRSVTELMPGSRAANLTEMLADA